MYRLTPRVWAKVLVAASTLLALPQAASADEVSTPTEQLTSIWNSVNPGGSPSCVAESENLTNQSYPAERQSFQSRVSSAIDSNGGFSWSVTIKDFLTLAYTPPNRCKEAFVLPPQSLAVYGVLFKWDTNFNPPKWAVCNGTWDPSTPFGSWVWATDHSSQPAWGLEWSGFAGSQWYACQTWDWNKGAPTGAGWFIGVGEGIAVQDGQIRGYSEVPLQAGTKPIWMN